MNCKIFHRSPSNPIITTGTITCPTTGIFNPGVAVCGDDVILLARVEDRQGLSSLLVARSSNGVDNWQWGAQPLLTPGLSQWPYEQWGCEDARITQLSDDRWIIVYTAVSRYGPAVALAETRDFESVERSGIIMSPNNKDGAVFAALGEKKWMLLHRPMVGTGEEHIWYAFSEDLLHWTNPGILMPERGGPWWDGLRIGAGAPPIETEEGYLMIYHGVKEVAARPVYRLGLALLDRMNPRHVTARTSSWVFGPEAPYEQTGIAPNIVYTCGAVLRGDEVWMYYGAADTCICLATAKVRDLLHVVHDLDYIAEFRRDEALAELLP